MSDKLAVVVNIAAVVPAKTVEFYGFLSPEEDYKDNDGTKEDK